MKLRREASERAKEASEIRGRRARESVFLNSQIQANHTEYMYLRYQIHLKYFMKYKYIKKKGAIDTYKFT